jgi:DNA repair exonuclease SbcCD ATPase subunit
MTDEKAVKDAIEDLRSVRGVLFSVAKTFDDILAKLGEAEPVFLSPNARDKELFKELEKRVDASLNKTFDKNVRPPMEKLFEQWIEAEKGRREAEERAKSFEKKYEEAREATRPIAEWFHDVSDTIERLIEKEAEQEKYVRQTSKAMLPLADKYEYAIRTLEELLEKVRGLPGWSGHETVRFRDELERVRKDLEAKVEREDLARRIITNLTGLVSWYVEPGIPRHRDHVRVINAANEWLGVQEGDGCPFVSPQGRCLLKGGHEGIHKVPPWPEEIEDVEDKEGT